MTPAWVLVAVAVLLTGGPRAGPGAAGSGARSGARSGVRSGAARPRSRLSPRSLELLTAGGAAVLALAVLGVGRGLVAALVLAPVGLLVVRRLAARVPVVPPGPELAITLELVAVALRAGRPVPAALELAAPAAPAHEPRLVRVAGLLRLGADAEEAWRAEADDPVLAPVAAAARRSAASGARLAAAFDQLAGQVRADLRSSAEARAHRAGVLAAAPLGLCFLPSFVCLGIAPIVIGVARSVLGG